MKRRRTLPDAAKSALTPLIDIAFLVLIFFMSLPLRQLDGKLQAQLPENGFNPIETDRPPPDKIRIRMRLHGERIVYHLGDHEAASPQGLEPILRRLDAEDRYEIHADPDIPWNDIVGMVDVLAGLEYKHLQFYGTRLPSKEVRKAIPLPEVKR